MYQGYVSWLCLLIYWAQGPPGLGEQRFRVSAGSLRPGSAFQPGRSGRPIFLFFSEVVIHVGKPMIFVDFGHVELVFFAPGPPRRG